MGDYRIIDRERLLCRLRSEADLCREEAERLVLEHESPEQVVRALLRAVALEEAAEIVHYETKHSPSSVEPDVDSF